MSQAEGDNKVASIEESDDALAKLKSLSRFTLFIAWIALFFTVVGIAAGYKNWMQINEQAKDASRGVEALEKQASLFVDKSSVVALNTALLDELDKRRQEVAQSVQILEEVKKTTLHAVESVERQASVLTQQQERAKQGFSRPNMAWRLAEMRFLLQVANQRLQLHHDKLGALQALKVAEDALLRLGSRKYTAVRKKLAEDIVALESFLVPNISAISQRIGDLIEVIDAMPVADEITESDKITLLPNDIAGDNSLLSQLVNGINNAVVVRKFDESVQKAMGIDEKEKLRNLLHLRLETLRLMMLQGLDYDYHQQLKLIKDTLEKYYPKMINGAMQKHLAALEKVTLSVVPPDISGSLVLLESISKKK